MSLKTYHQKRNFKVTPEPKGKTERKHRTGLSYVIQKHDATRLHYDFRLEWDGTLKSWAVPKGPSLDPAKKSLAVQVEDHPIDYGDFEGIIPRGEYGGGTVLLWDRGTWDPLHDPEAGLRQGKLHFVLHGEKLQGEWSLVQMHGRSGDGGKNWLLMKMNDRFASKTRDVLAAEPQSVKSKRTLARIATDSDRVWGKNGEEEKKKRASPRASHLPDKISPQLAVLAEHPPKGEQWLHEIKFDGYRILAFVESHQVTLYTRNGLDWTDRFPGITRAFMQLKVESAVVDGEAVVLDDRGRSDFQALQGSLKEPGQVKPVLFAFDLLFLDGEDLRNRPLLDRKERLKEILEKSHLHGRINFSDHVRGDGQKVIDRACDMSLEGIVSKRVDAPYVSRRDASWLKSKCGNRQEFIIIGYTDPKGSREGFGSLLLGYHDDQKRLVYAGRVGTGFDNAKLLKMREQLREIEQDGAPTDVAPPVRERRNAHWVKPILVAEASFTSWTRDGSLRHPVFIALRSDKPASQIIREKAIEPQNGHGNGTRASAKHQPDKKKHFSANDGASAKARASRASAKQEAPAAGSGGESVAGVRLTHPDKLLYSEERVSKRQLAEYYEQVQEWMLPHVIDRPLALVRCPDGMAGKCFFQRNWTETLPKDIGKVQVGQGAKREQHIAVRDIAGVISCVQMGVLEIHTWNCASSDIEHPDQLIFDLDPGPDVAWKRVVEGARLLRKMLESLKLPTFLKTSGGKGLHLTIPIEPNIDWDEAKGFCHTIADELVNRSGWFVANMRKDLRGGKIYIDYNRNGNFATAVAPYSSRARTGAPVSMPISWEELGKLESAAQFTVENASKYLARRRKDPWLGYARARVDVRKLVQDLPSTEEK